MNVIIILLSFLILFVLCVLWVILVNINKKMDYFANIICGGLDTLEERALFSQNVSSFSVPVLQGLLAGMQQQAVARENYELAKTLNQVLENIDNFCVEQKRKYEQ